MLIYKNISIEIQKNRTRLNGLSTSAAKAAASALQLAQKFQIVISPFDYRVAQVENKLIIQNFDEIANFVNKHFDAKIMKIDTKISFFAHISSKIIHFAQNYSKFSCLNF